MEKAKPTIQYQNAAKKREELASMKIMKIPHRALERMREYRGSSVLEKGLRRKHPAK